MNYFLCCLIITELCDELDKMLTIVRNGVSQCKACRFLCSENFYVRDAQERVSFKWDDVPKAQHSNEIFSKQYSFCVMSLVWDIIFG